MNKDQAKGNAKIAAGTVQRGAGKLIGSKTQQAKGLGKQLVGKAQRSLGDARAALETSRKTRSAKKRA